MFSYLDIYNTAGRLLKKLKNTNRSNTDYMDDLYAFFIFCYHLKDHLIEYLNSNDVELKAHDVENFITRNSELCECGNLCTIIKHANNRNYKKERKKYGGEFGPGELDMGINDHISIANITARVLLTRVDELNEEKEQQIQAFLHQNDAQIGYVPRKGSSSTVTIDQHYSVVDSVGNSYNALDFAEKCYDLWTIFLWDNRLLNNEFEGSK